MEFEAFSVGKALAGGKGVMNSALNIFSTVAVLLSTTACNPPDDRTSRNSTNQSSLAPAEPSTMLASATLSPASGSNVRGTVNFFESKGAVQVVATVTGLTPGSHGFHIHEKGDCSAPDGMSAGGHFNPTGMQHGGPGDSSRHAGDFGNLEADALGNAQYSKSFSDLKFDGDASIVGKAVIVHAKADDLKTQPSGDAGGRVACGVIEKK